MIPERMLKARARQAAQDYMHGTSLRAQSDELSDKRLASKFEVHGDTIKRVRKHTPVRGLDQEDQQLIRACAAERERIEEQLPRLSKTYLSKHYGISIDAIDLELELAGFENPRTKKAEGVLA